MGLSTERGRRLRLIEPNSDVDVWGIRVEQGQKESIARER
jgi:hypothetical protein